MKSLIKNNRAIAVVTLFCIMLIPVTFIVWIVTWTPVAMMIDALAPLSSDPQVTRIINLANMSAAALLILEIAGLVIWWVASAVKPEEQTYGGYGY